MGKHNLGEEFTDLLRNIFKYNPHERFTPFQALCHPFFNELRDEHVYNKLRKEFSEIDLFTFNGTPERNIRDISRLVPNWYH